MRRILLLLAGLVASLSLFTTLGTSPTQVRAEAIPVSLIRSFPPKASRSEDNWLSAITTTTSTTSTTQAPRPVVRVSHPTPVYAGGVGGAWACIRQHESGGNYADNTGNGYSGAYQFDNGTWHSAGGYDKKHWGDDPYPNAASAPPAEQDRRAQILQSQRGWAPWPNTSRACGLR